MQIIFFGTPQFAVPTLKRLLEHPSFEVIGIVTQPDKRRGRGSQLIPSAVKKFVLDCQIPIWQPKRLKKAQNVLAALRQAEADVFVVVAYGQILAPEVLAMPKLGCINVHGSILPQYRGAAPIQWSLYYGERETGITTMLMNEGMDTGDMLFKAYTPIHLLDNAYQIAEKLAPLGAELLVDTLEQLRTQQWQQFPQNEAEATYAPLIQKSDYSINWSRSAIAIHNQVRGFYPNCVSAFRDSSLKVMATVPLGDDYWTALPEKFQVLQQKWQNLAYLSGKPGEIVANIKNFGPLVQTGEGLLLLTEVQLSGKRPQSGWNFVNGTHLGVGERLLISKTQDDLLIFLS